MKRHTTLGVIAALVLAMAGLVALSTLTPITAGAANPAPSVALPAASLPEMDNTAPQQNSDGWTIGAMTFTSLYPDGFSFTLEAESSGGPIVSARVEWQHRELIRANQPIRVRRETGTIDAENDLISARWTPNGSTSVPPWVAVYYTWKLRDEAGNEYSTERILAEYEDNSRPWIRYESEDALVFSEGLPEAAGQMVGQALAENRDKYIAGWGDTLPYKPRVILFHDFETFNEWQLDSYDTTSLGYVSVGLTSDAWGGTAQVLFRSTEALAYETVLHEVEHMHQYEFLFPGRTKTTPGWFIEGDARFYEALDNSFDVNLVKDLAATGNLPTLLQGIGPSIDGENSLRGYAMGYMFWTYLTEQWGMDIHAEVMGLLAEDLTVNAALEVATGLDPLTLERQWRAWLGATPIDPPTLVPTPTMLPFLNTPTPYGN